MVIKLELHHRRLDFVEEITSSTSGNGDVKIVRSGNDSSLFVFDHFNVVDIDQVRSMCSTEEGRGKQGLYLF